MRRNGRKQRQKVFFVVCTGDLTTITSSTESTRATVLPPARVGERDDEM